MKKKEKKVLSLNENTFVLIYYAYTIALFSKLVKPFLKKFDQSKFSIQNCSTFLIVSEKTDFSRLSEGKTEPLQ